MVRKLALAVSLALGTLSVPAHALGLGELDSKSTLNQNFRGDIALLSVGPDEINGVRVKLADAEAFKRAGVERPFYLSLLKFEPMIAQRGKPVVRVTSEFPIREPFLNFLIEVNWPKGRLLREYTVLLDPPTTTTRRPPVVKPAVKTARPAPKPASAKPSKPAAAGAASPSVPSPTVSAAASSGSEYGPVKANDTAWGIATKVRPRGVSMEQMMMALLAANPEAFIRNDINRLRRGRILRVPSLAEIQKISRAEARAAYREQQDAWLARRNAKLQRVAQTEQPPAEQAEADTTARAAGPGAAEAAADQLRIATARPQGEGEAGAGDDDAVSPTASDIKARLIAARENAETSRQEAEALRSRVDDLQARLQDMQKLLSLKDDQLAQLQDNVVTQEAAPQGDGETPAASAESVIDEVILANQAAADAVGAESSTEAASAADVTETPAVSVADAAAEAPESPEALAQAIDNAVADLVGDRAPAPEDYAIEDIAPQIDPDRIVLMGDVVETPATETPAVTDPAAAGDFDIPPRIDPDRIVLGLDSAPGDSGAEPAGDAQDTIDVAMDQAADAAPSAEVVIEGVGDAPATAQEPVAVTDAEAPGGSTDTTAEPAPSEAAATPESTESAADSVSGDILPPAMARMVEQNIVPIAVGGVALLGLFGWLATRRRRNKDDAEGLLASAGAGAGAAAVDSGAVAAAATEASVEAEVAAVDEPILNPDALDDLPDSSFLDDFSPSDINALQDETGEVDPVSEADVYIAYGRYQQAEELLKQAMDRDPDRLALKHKLLEVHYATRDSAAFTALAQEMLNAGQDSADEEAWSRAKDMGRELDPSNPMFQADELGGRAFAAGGATAAAVAAAASVADTDSLDNDSLSLEDLEISELNAAYEEETSSLSELDPVSEVSIELDLDDSSELIQPNEPLTSPEPIALNDVEPLEFEMPDAESSDAGEDTASVDAISDTLDLDSMMAEAEAAVDQDNLSPNLDSDFSAAELQAQLDELSDLSVLDSDLDDSQRPAAAAPDGDVGLVSEDAGAAPASEGLDQPLNLDTAFDSADEDDGLETLDLDDTSEASSEDEVATKLDLASAYVEMGDQDGARNILEEVMVEGNDGQRSEAEKLLAELG